ncbi:energy-coupling factor ABC transporter ATP-binding protein [Cytobacillus firmus]|uniref:energy-coupling factor ABC transporter ATP-binding protein n=1 Tax=Cytobacillus firmus TaxID=1399 RepID=UPI0034A4B726
MLTTEKISWIQNEKTILQNICLQLMEGERIGIVGPNGSGKSSLLKVLSFLVEPTTGHIHFRDINVSGRVPLEIRRRISIVFQEPLLFNATVYENVATGLKFRGVPKQEVVRLVDMWLDRFQISHLVNQQARSLSGGEAQRVSLARAMILDPDILFLDEPFSALDVPTKESLITDLGQILESTCTTTVLVSHDFKDIIRLTERAIVLMNGQLAAEGSPIELLERQQSEQVEQFLSHWKKDRF